MNELNEQENDAIQNNSKHYFLGTLGAIIGAFVASIPWILMYVYGNMILAALSILIAIGALKGYQIFKGTIDKKLPVIISIVSLLAVIITTLLIIPMLLIMQDGYAPTIENFQLLYGNEEFLSAIIHDLIISIIFTILGISGVISNINKQINDSSTPLKEIKISSTLSDPNQFVNQDQAVHSVKDVFINHDAMSKETAIDKNTILTELKELENGKQLFNTLRTQQIIRKYKGKYYFSEKAEKSVGYRFGLLFGKVMIVVIIIVIAMISLIVLLDNSADDNTTKNSLTNDISQSTTKTTCYSLPSFGMEFTLPDNMYFASDSDLEYIFGSSAADFYEFALYNQEDLFSCFTKKIDEDELDSYYDSLKESFEEDADYKIISDYKEETISGFKFTTIEAQAYVDGTLFNDVCLIYFKNNKLLVFEYTYLAKNAEKSRDVLKSIINKK